MSISGLLNLFRTFHTYDCSDTLRNPPPLQDLLYTYANNIQIFRSADQLIYQYGPHQGQTNIPIGEDLLAYQPLIQPNGSVHFERKAAVTKSKFSSVTLDENHCAITLIDNASCDLKHLNPLRAGGHTSILLEGVQNNHYFMKRAHLLSTEDSRAKIVIDDEAQFLAKKVPIYNQSSTWITTKEQAQRMLTHIEREAADQEAGNICVLFDIRGRVAPRPLPSGVRLEPHNCFTWAKEKLALAGIQLYGPNPFVSIPKLDLKPASIHSKQQVQVLCKIHPGQQLVDITDTVHAQMNGLSWKPLLNQSSVAAVTEAFLNSKQQISTDYKQVQLIESYDVQETKVIITIEGQGTRILDVTKVVQKILNEERSWVTEREARQQQALLDRFRGIAHPQLTLGLPNQAAPCAIL